MTEETDGFDKSNPYRDKQDACSAVLFYLISYNWATR